MYGCECWTVKKAECWRIDAFELWCWRVPWTARSNQSILKEINPEYSLEGLRLKFQYFGHLMWRATSLESTLMVGKIEGRRRRRRQRTKSWMASPTWVWANSGRWWRTGKPGVLQSMGLQSQTRLSGWTTILDLQCGVNFCCTAEWLSYTYICIYIYLFFSIMTYLRMLNIVSCAIQ